MLTPFHQRYVGDGMRAGPFLPLGAGDAQTRAARMRHAAQRSVPASLMQLLREQNAGSPARDAHLELLARGRTALVITGQQVGLFLGPLYTLAKAASAVVWAQQLRHETGVDCVPLFWLQTEDHDFAEIASCTVPRSGDLPPLTLSLDDDSKDLRIAVAQRRVGAQAPFDALAEALQGKPFAEATLALLRRHYRPAASLASAFAGVLHELFAEHGLLVFDPRHPATMQLAAPVIARALSQSAVIEAVLAARCQALEAAGHKVQIHPRPNTPLPFVHRPDAQGERHRVSSDEVPGLLETLHRDPFCFSTSALLRPIMQDTLLPTALYIGGPAEIDYFAQGSVLYPLFDLPPPLVALRGRIRLLTPRVQALLQQLQLQPSDLDGDESGLQQRVLAPVTTLNEGPNDAWLKEVDARLSAFAAQGRLAKETEKTRRSLHHSLGRLQRKHQRDTMTHETVLSSRLQRLQWWLRPQGAPQERVHSFMAFSARVGSERLIDRIVASIDPLHPQLRDVVL